VTTTSAALTGPPPYDPECAAVLEGMAEFPPLTAEGIPAMRAGADSFMPRPTSEELARGGSLTVEERTVPGAVPHARWWHVRRKCPARPGYVLDLAEVVGAAVVSVEYRLAPETPHPGPVEDCYGGWCGPLSRAVRGGIDPERIVLIGGSAGGGIAAALVLMARDRGGPALAGELLMCLMVDDRQDTPSVHQMAGRRMWNRSDDEGGWTASSS
jgi:hypothetical protein